MIQGNKSIFLDQAWAHHAYVSSGIWALQHVRGLQVIDGTSDKPLTDYRAWDGIYEALENEDIGLLREGNQSLLRREQEIVMQPLYEVMKNVWLDPGTELGQYLATGFGGIAYPPVNAAGEINIDEMFSINGRNPVHLIGPKLRDVVPNGKLSSLADRWTWIDNDETGMLQIWLGTSTGLPGFTPANRRNLNSAVFWQHASLYSQLPTNGDFHLDQFPPAW
jgi:hypothetical protein